MQVQKNTITFCLKIFVFDFYSLLDRHNIRSYQILHSLDTPNEVIVIGTKVVPLQEELSEVAERSGYSVVTKNLETRPSTGKNPSTSTWISLCGGLRKSGSFSLVNSAEHHISVINAIVEAKDKRRKQHQEVEYFGLTTAHSFLTEEQRRGSAMASTVDFGSMFTNAVSSFLREKFHMKVQEGHPVDIVGHPQSLYLYWKPKGRELGKHDTIQDITFFKLDRHHVIEDGLLRMPERHGTSLSWEESFREAYIKKISSLDELTELEDEHIFCQGKRGKICNSGVIKDGDCVLRTHLSFFLEKDEK